MRAAESRRAMVVRHIAAQEFRIEKQKALIMRLSDHQLPTEQASAFLADMENLLGRMQDELADARIS